MADLRLFANTSNLIRFILKHATTGQGLTGLTSASSGLIISTIADNEATATAYTVAGSTIETITTLGTFATPTATKCRFKEVDAANHKGLYEFQFADARFAVASSKRLIISVTGATNLLDTDYEIQLVQFNPYDAVRMGQTALPNAAAEAAGGLFTRGTGAGQINQAANGMIDTNPVRLNNVSQSLLDLKDFADDGYDPATNKVQGVVLTDTLTTYTGNTPQTGDSYAVIDTEIGTLLTNVATILAAVDTEVAAIKAKTDNLSSDPADASDIATSFSSIATTLATIAGYIDAEVAIIKGVTDKLDTTLEVDGLVYRFTTNALEQAPAGGGGGGTGLINFVYGGEWVLNQQNRIDFYLQDTAGAAVTGLGSGYTLTLAKNGGAFAASAGTKAEIGSGWYTYLATAGEADTIGTIAIQVVGAGAVEQPLEYVVKQRTAGAIAFTYTLTSTVTGLPIEGAIVWITTDLAGTNTIWSGVTDAFGIARDSASGLPYLDPGTYYFFRQHGQFTFTNPDTETIS